MIDSPLLVLELGFERTAVIGYRPDVLWKLPARLYAYEPLSHTLFQQSLSLGPRNDIRSLAQRLVSPWLRRRSECEVARSALVFRITAIAHDDSKRGELCGIRIPFYASLRIERSPCPRHLNPQGHHVLRTYRVSKQVASARGPNDKEGRRPENRGRGPLYDGARQAGAVTSGSSPPGSRRAPAPYPGRRSRCARLPGSGRTPVPVPGGRPG